MPHGNSIFADELMEAISQIEFNQMMIYVDSAQSASMFQDLPTDREIIVMTATDAAEASYSTYCLDESVADGARMGTCLGDSFSVNWMQNTESLNPKRELVSS